MQISYIYISKNKIKFYINCNWAADEHIKDNNIFLLLLNEMSSEYSVSNDVKDLIGDIIKENNWEPVKDVKYYPGTEAGDGYASVHVAVDIIKEDETSRLFVKYALKMPPGMDDGSMDRVYANEVYFYEVVYPAYMKFVKKRQWYNVFRNVPKCYGTSTKNVIALENIREKGYTLFNRKDVMNEKHMILVLKTFAKFHAISYAFKDQEKEEYDKLESGTNQNFLNEDMNNPFAKMFIATINDTLSKLDAVADEKIIEKCDAEVLARNLIDAKPYYDEYSIITQGDCWCNNMMFSYEQGNRDPTDIMLVDWQLLRPAPPVLDISYFFYTIADEEALNKLDYYLKIYYSELQNQIKILGSDPDKVYPFSIFEKHWKQHCKYGFAMAFMILKVMLINKDEIPKMEEMDLNEIQKSETINFFSKFTSEDEYIRKIRVLGEFMVKRNYL